MKYISVFILFILILRTPIHNKLFAQEANIRVNTSLSSKTGLPGDTNNNEVFVGEFFGIPVTAGNYFFVRSVLTVFGNKWGPRPQTAEDFDKYTWDQLLLSFEAFRRGIVVNREEIEEEINNIAKDEKLEFDWKQDREQYAEWVKKKTRLVPEHFENQLTHLLQLNKLRDKVLESIEPKVSNKEMYDEFLNEHNSLEVELIRFDELADAKAFYKKVRRKPKLWDQEKEKTPDEFKRPGAVSLEFLINIWGFPRDACFKMLKKRIDTIYPPTPIYKGHAVFRILAKGLADKKVYKDRKDSYYKQIEDRKKRQGYDTWFEDLKKMANIKPYRGVLDELLASKTGAQEK